MRCAQGSPLHQLSVAFFRPLLVYLPPRQISEADLLDAWLFARAVAGGGA